MKRYTVKQVARMAGVSVRTLHHYDDLGLLKPAEVGANGYRYYGREELLRLQQILLHRELEFPLETIAEVLNAPGFDRVQALKRHREVLASRASRYRRLIKTLDATLAELEQETDMDDKDLYKGFAPEKQAEYEAWLIDRGGDQMKTAIDASKQAMKSMCKADFQAMMAKWEGIEGDMAKALTDGLPVDSVAVQAIMRRHHAWIAISWGREPEPESFAGLGQIYLDHPDFRAKFDNKQAGLAEYFALAMRAFADAELAG